MATTLGFKPYFDLPMWRPESPALGVFGAGGALAWDLRNDSSKSSNIYALRSAALFEAYDPIAGDWVALGSPALTGTFGAGAAALFHSSQGPSGTLAAGATTTTITLTTALPAAVGVNQLSNRGDKSGFRIRIMGLVSGKTEERIIISNTSGTTPVLTLDTALTFTPALGDKYELLSGRVYLWSAGLLAAGAFKYYDIATNSYSGNLSIVNLPATIATDSAELALSEAHVSNDRVPGEGFVSGAATYGTNGATTKRAIQSTAATSTTITGAGMPADLVANEYTNFQVRIVEDTTTPTAVGQRRRISAHTAGATGAFTVAAFAVTPSIAAKFVIENDNDKILFRSTGTTALYNYNIAADTWDSATTWAAPVAHGAGVTLTQGFGYTRDGGNARHSMIYSIRGGNVSSIDVLDIAGAATGAWSNAIVYGKQGQLFTTGTSAAYESGSLDGRFIHISINGTQRTAKFDMKARLLDASCYLRSPPGAAVVGQKMATGLFIDGTTKATFVYQISSSLASAFSMVSQA